MQEALRTVEREAERQTVSAEWQTVSGMADCGEGRGDSDSIGGGHPLQSLEDVFSVEGLVGATAAGVGEEDTVYGTALEDAAPPPRRPPLPSSPPLLALSET